MSAKLIKKLSLGAGSYVTIITWKGFFTQSQVILPSIVVTYVTPTPLRGPL